MSYWLWRYIYRVDQQEIVKSTKFLGVHLAEDLTWSLNTSTITKKAQLRLYFLRRLRKAHLPPPILTTFYRGTIESILSSCIAAWFGNCTASDRKSLQRVVRTAEKIIGVSLPTITDIYTTRCIRKANSIVGDHTHPSQTLFTLLPSGKSNTKSKEEIGRIIVLEQFLNVINPELKSWITECSPASAEQAVAMVEAFVAARQAEGTFLLGKPTGIKGIHTTPYHPQTDGLTERFNKTLKQTLRKLANSNRTDWDTWLPYVLFACREVPQA
ncbi:hypothetical protein NFI96_008962 [Prochilodus magdalenae]|nr:hypothetical protein NFI96_008962 [Prochilodus magdalenae]